MTKEPFNVPLWTKVSAVDLINTIQNTYAGLLKKKYTITLCWIPAHVGIPGNEQIDSLAKEALAFTHVSKEVGYTIEEVYPLIKQHTLALWQKQYTESEEVSKEFKKLHPRVSHTPNNASYPKRYQSKIFRLATGINLLKNRQHTIKKAPSPNCDKCNEPETSEHYLMCCTEFQTQRDILFRACTSLTINPTFKNILTSPEVSGALFTYLDTTHKLI